MIKKINADAQKVTVFRVLSYEYRFELGYPEGNRFSLFHSRPAQYSPMISHYQVMRRRHQPTSRPEARFCVCDVGMELIRKKLIYKICAFHWHVHQLLQNGVDIDWKAQGQKTDQSEAVIGFI